MKPLYFRFLPLIFVTTNLSAESVIEIRSGMDDFIGRGKNYTFTSDNALIGYQRYQDDGISVTIDNLPSQAPNWWTLDVVAPEGGELKPGLYDNVVRIPFQKPTQAGMLFFGNGRYCNALSGWFEVYSIKYDQSGEIESLDMEFEQRCKGYGSSLHGRVSFNVNSQHENLFDIP